MREPVWGEHCPWTADKAMRSISPRPTTGTPEWLPQRGVSVALTVLSRAKINLSLDVVGTRPDGYHEIASVMQSLALGDVLTFEHRPRGVSLEVCGKPVAAGEKNLVLMAARLFAALTGCRRGAAITLRKNIPVAAGLGGGSADAAGTLIGLNRLWGLDRDTRFLRGLGARLGADVPFCVTGGTALATGLGEELAQLPPLPELCVLLLKPSYEVSTAAVYRAYDDLGRVRPPVAREMAEALRRNKWRDALQKCCNALEDVTFKQHPDLKQLKRKLMEAGAVCALMSGSGPTVFGVFETVREADAAGSLFRAGGIEVIVTATSDRGVVFENSVGSRQ
ncbi:MAG: 4-(cytidine 5'-diphospho)-2-C-methyl-D-erythritol kinase [Bacillota bacterium]